MHTLRELQQEFMQAMFDRERPALTQHLAGTDSESVWRTAVYRNNTFSNLQDALASTYSVIVKLVGSEFFHYAAKEYCYQYPSVSGDLHHFGKEFSDFLAAHSAVAQLAYLPDVAKLEWICHQAYFAADHAPLGFERLTQVAPERYGDLKFKLHPACALLESAFPVDRIWAVNQDDYAGEQAVDLSSGGVAMLVKRAFYRVEVLRLSRNEWGFLQALSIGQTFSAACDTALQIDPHLNLSTTLQHWVEEAILVDFAIAV
jgi:hypothetical protein